MLSLSQPIHAPAPDCRRHARTALVTQCHEHAPNRRRASRHAGLAVAAVAAGMFASLHGAAATVAQVPPATSGSPASGRLDPGERVTLIGDSIATAVQWNPRALALLGQGIDLKMQVAVCRRLAGSSCPYEGGQVPTLAEVVAAQGRDLGPTVVVAVGYNDYEQTFAANVDASIRALLAAGVQRILWVTLRAARQSYPGMNDVIKAAAAKHPQVTVVDWNRYSRSHPDWFQNDGIHLFPPGALAFASFLRTALVRALTAPPSIVLPSPRLAVARVGRRYAEQLVARGGTAPYRWQVASGSLPGGLRLRPDGRIAGIPARPGSSTLLVRAVDGRGRATTRRTRVVVER